MHQITFVTEYDGNFQMVSFVFGTLPAMIAVHLLRYFSVEKRKLLQDVSQFDVRNADCRSEFDKEFIHAAITEWYGTGEKFSEYVRGQLFEEMVAGIHRSSAPVAYSLLVATALVSAGLEECLGMWKADAPLISIVTQFIGDVIANDVLWFTMCLHIVVALCDFFPPKGRGCFEYVKTLLIFLAFAFLVLIGGTLSLAFCTVGLGAALLWLCFTLLPMCCFLLFSRRIIRHSTRKLAAHAVGDHTLDQA